MPQADLDIVAQAVDNATATLASVQRAIGDLSKNLPNLKGQLQQANGAANSMTKGLGGIGTAAQKASGLLGGIISTAAGFGVAQVGIGLVSGAVGQFKSALIGLNTETENVKAQLLAFTKSGEKADEILAMIREEADKTPFSFQAMSKATAGLMSSARMANEPLLDLVKTAEILAASNPQQGLEGAAFALREAVSGDFTSIIERFNLPRSYINKLKEEGVPALEIVRRAMLGMGYDADLVSNLAKTASGRWSTLMDTFDGIKIRLSKPLFDRLKSGLEAVQNWLDNNKDVIDLWSARIGAAIDIVAEGITALAGIFWNALGSVASIVTSIGQDIYEALQWLNPFATHSPALVDQVKDGVEDIVGSYVSIGAIKQPLNSASQAVRNFASNTKEALTDMVAASKDRLELLKDALSAAKDELRRFTEAPIEGSKEFEDRLYSIEQEATKVKYALNQMKLSGATKESMKGLEDSLDKLGLQADQVRLEERLKLDPLRKQLKELSSDKGGELPFQAIVDGITMAKQKIATLGPAVQAQEQIWKAQQQALKDVTEAQQEATKAQKATATAVNTAAANIKQPLEETKQVIDEWKGKFEQARADIITSLSPIRAFIDGSIVPAIHAIGETANSVTQRIDMASLVGTLRSVGESLRNAFLFAIEHKEEILAAFLAIRTFLLVMAIPAFLAWAGAATAAAVATIAALLPVLAPIAAIGAAAALLVAAWKGNWGDIQGKVAAVWAFLEPVFQEVRNWLGNTLSRAVTNLSTLWERNLLPALRNVAKFINGTVIPIFQAIWNVIDKNVIPLIAALVDVWLAALGLAFRLIAAAWSIVLGPALSALWSFIESNLGPVLRWLADTLLLGVTRQMEEIGWVWDNVLGPVLAAIGAFVENNVGPALEWLGNAVLANIRNQFDAVGSAIQWVIDQLQVLADWLNRVPIPDWLRGNSPPPMADWLHAIGQEMRQLSAIELPKLTAQMTLTPVMRGSMGVGGSDVANTYNQPQTVLVQDRAAAALILEGNRDRRIRRLVEAM